MKPKEILSTKWFKIVSNRYVLVLTAFIFWMLFLDSNSWLIHHELNTEIDNLQKNKQHYLDEIAKDKAVIQKLSDSLELEKFARREYFMKRENEEIFIVEYREAE